MKINIKNNILDIKSGVLFVSIGSKNGSTNSPQVNDEIVKEISKDAGTETKRLYLKCDEEEKMNLRKLFLLVRKMIIKAKSVKAEKICFNFNDFKFSNIKLTDIELG